MAEGLFDKVYNPDVLSCLANLSNDEVFTPPEIANQMLDLLPQELFADPNTTFLDPACKSGVFLREIAKRLLKAQLPGYEEIVHELDEKKRNHIALNSSDLFFEETLQKKVDHIFHKQLYGISITELTSLLSRRSVYCSKYPNTEFSITRFDNVEGNIRFRRVEHGWQRGKCVFCGASQIEYDRSDNLETHAYEWIHTMKPEDIFQMKFDVIISNPPYQLSTSSESAQAKPIYHLFIENAKALKPRYITMIIPSRWFSGGMGLDSFRNDMLNDERLSVLVDYQNAAECFPGVEIKGGVCYFLWDKKHTGNTKIISHVADKTTCALRPLLEHGLDVFIRYNEAISIVHKVLELREPSFADFINPQRFFGFPTKFKAFKEKPEGEHIIKIYANKATGYVKEKDILMNVDAMKKHKVFISEAYNGGDGWPHQIINKPFLGCPGEVCTDTYMCVGPFANKEIATNVCAYMRTKFFRFLVMLIKNTQHGAKKVYTLVPQQDFTKLWTDEELYSKYGLSDEEIGFIDSMIKPIDLGGDLDG